MPIQHLDKIAVADYIQADIIGRRDIGNSPLPKLAFDNEKHDHPCPNDNCSGTATSFQYNLAAAAGFDEVVYEWNPDLDRLYIKGTACPQCKLAHINLHENSPDHPGETIRADDGD